MILHDVLQGGYDWLALRIGLPTCSGYDRVLTPKTHKPAAARSGYRCELMAEWLLGNPLEWGSSGWVERGSALEVEARNWYELQNGHDIQQVGFVSRDDGLTGGSPDGLVAGEGVLEIKCLAAKNHTAHLLGEAEESYIGQCQGYLYLTDREWVDMLFYNPSLPPVLTRVKRDEAYIAALVPVLDEFAGTLERDKSRFWEHRHRHMQSSPATEYAPFSPDELERFHRELAAAEVADVIDRTFATEILGTVITGRWRQARVAQEKLRQLMLRGVGPRLVQEER